MVCEISDYLCAFKSYRTESHCLLEDGELYKFSRGSEQVLQKLISDKDKFRNCLNM